MAHHSTYKPFENQTMRKLMEDSNALREPFGPTGKHPEGKIAPNDEGEIRFGVARDGDKVLVDFGSPVHSLGMTREQARDFGRLLITRAGYSCRIGFED